MRRRLVLMSGAVGLCCAGLFGTGCSTMILMHQHSVGLDGPASSYFPLAMSRQEVETKRGKPVTSRALPDGGRADIYKYSLRNQGSFLRPGASWRWDAFWLGFLSASSLGTLEIGFTPMTLYEVSKYWRTATFTYDPDDRLTAYGPPPPYGTPDGAVGALSLSEIKEGCRSDTRQDPRDRPGRVAGELPARADYHYDECVVRRLAIWGIE